MAAQTSQDTQVNPFYTSFFMIMLSELGDKTFLIAAILAMKHDRFTIFCASFGALAIMSVFSAVLGHTMPFLLPLWATKLLACGLFWAFGCKLLFDAYALPNDMTAETELLEIQTELEHDATVHGLHILETGGDPAAIGRSVSNSEPLAKLQAGARNLISMIFSTTFIEAFTLTFLGEWGDRSQLATIVMAAGQQYLLVIFGTVIGHAMCTILAVFCGRFLASHLSVRQITVSGAILFLLFAVVAGVECLSLFGLL